MGPRRPVHDGTLSTLPSGAVHARLRLGGHRYAATFASRALAAAWLAALRVRYEDGTLTPETARPAAAPPPRPPGATVGGQVVVRTVGAQLDAFLVAVRGEVSEKTWHEHERDAHLHLAPLAPLALAELRPDHIRQRRTALLDGSDRDRPHAPRTLRRILTTLRRALDQAVEDRLLDWNPAAFVHAPRVAPARQRVLSRQEQAAVLSCADAAGDRLVALWTLALRSGARLSELLGLTWDDVDLPTGTIVVWRQLDTPVGGRPVWKATTKTPAGVAPLHLPRRARAALLAHRSRQDGEKLRYAGRYHDFGLVFATRYGTALSQRHVLDYWKTACARAGVPVLKFHEARHTAASTYLAAGVPVPEVSQILRHASPAVTSAIYAHAIERYSRGATDALDRYLGEDALGEADLGEAALGEAADGEAADA
jgi:integrase